MRKTSFYCFVTALHTLVNCVNAGQAFFDTHEQRQSRHAEPGSFADERVPSIPLIVKSPYLQAWMPVGANQPRLAGKWCQFWTGQEQGWTGFIRVDGHAYTFLGDPSLYGQSLAIQESYQLSATSTIFSFLAGPVSFNVTFLTPTYPKDPVQQSLPFGFYEISFRSRDGLLHDVQIYTDIAGDWLSGDLATPIYWETHREDGLAWHTAEAFAPQTFDEYDEKIMSGQVTLATEDTNNLTVRTGNHHDVRRMFVKFGGLDDGEDTQYRRIGENWPVFAFAKSYQVANETKRALFSLGHVRDLGISYRRTVLSHTESLSLLYQHKYPTLKKLVQAVFGGYPIAVKASKDLDLQVYQDARKISYDYALLCALSLRQAFATIELTHHHAYGIQAWVKEISSDGNMLTVDIIYPMLPMLLYLCPEYIGWMMQPLLEYQSKGPVYESCAHDLGMHYPYATGPSDGSDSHMPVEESGNILIIALAYAQATGDTSLLQRYYSLFEQWTIFLMRKALIPELQLSTDDFMGPAVNQSSLALKGGIGIRAMAEIARLVDRNGTVFETAANLYFSAWEKLATSRKRSKHLVLSYEKGSSWMLAYNLYAEQLLGVVIVPKHIYERQDAFYPSQKRSFGIPLDSRRTWTKTDWLSWAAAATSNKTVSHMLLQGPMEFIRSGNSDAPLSDWYDTVDGSSPGFRARPVVAGHFSFLALEKMRRMRAQLP
ncbi:DUF1793-domain-containing protein [Cystobasidium minutum MCA 4210]|uniref:DUF1793-domain-containing protein n=1 Tax=Cystobasidium minutum MCA 4210 TaxID=1397322 RepID=UPI0034CF4A00|eukprot:jgi/Rhomi1/94510/CE94509_2008